MSRHPIEPPGAPDDSRQRPAVIVLGIVAAASLIGLGALLTRPDDRAAVTSNYGSVADTRSLPTPPTETVATAAGSTTASPPRTSAAAPVTSAPSDLPRRLKAEGAVLTKPVASEQRTESSPNDCGTLAEVGWQDISCDVAQVGGETFTTLVEFSLLGSDGFASRAYLFRHGSDGAEHVVLEAIDDQATRFNAGEVDAAFAPIGPHGEQEAVFTFLRRGRPQGVDEVAVDVVQLPVAEVAAHQELKISSITTSTGQLDTYSAAGSSAAGPWLHDTIEFDRDAWYVISEQVVSHDEVPRSQFT